MGSLENFDHESIQEADGIGCLLEALTEGFKQRRLTLRTESGSITLTPTDLVDLALKVTRRKDQSRLTIKIAWREATLEKVRQRNFISIEA